MNRRIAIAVTALLAGCPTISSAQNEPKVITPLEVASDANGVNILSGLTRIDPPHLAVPAAPRLTFSRLQDLAPYVTGSVPANTDGVKYYFSVHTGGETSESFKCVSDQCVSVNGTGSVYLDTNFVQAKTGALYTFDQVYIDSVSPQTGARTYVKYASSIRYPDGEVIRFTYQSFPQGDRTYLRPTLVTSSVGYSISVTYHTTTYTAGWSTPKDVTLFATSTPGTPLAKLSYGLGTSTITDIGGRVYNCTNCSNGLGNDVETWEGSLTLPTESSASRTITKLSTATMVGSVNVDGATTSYGYTNVRRDASGLGYLYDKVTITGPDGTFDQYTTTSNINGKNHITSWLDRLGKMTAYDYDSKVRLTTITYPEGNKVAVIYDDFGNLIQKTISPKPGSSLAAKVETAFAITTDCDYLPNVLCYRIRWSKDALNRQTDYAYNSAGQLTEQTDPADDNGVRRKTLISYSTDGFSRPLTVRLCGATTTCGTNSETRTEYEYWGATALPRIKREIDASRQLTLTTTYSYDAAGRITAIDGPLSGTDDTTFFRYDIYGRKTWEVDAKGRNGLWSARKITYRDADDKILTIDEGSLPSPTSSNLTYIKRTNTLYDTRRNPSRMVLIAGGNTYSVENRSYSLRNQLLCQTLRMNPAVFSTVYPTCTLGAEGTYGSDRVTRYSYYDDGKLKRIERAVGTSLAQSYVTYTYTDNGQRRHVIDANGNRAAMYYDGFDRLSGWYFPSASAVGSTNSTDYESYQYDAVDNRTWLRKRDGKVLTYRYDGLDRLVIKNVPASASGASSYSVYYDYNVPGLLTAAKFGSKTGLGISNTYDALGRQLSTTSTMGGGTRTITYDNDAAGNRIRITHPDSIYVQLAYEATGAMHHADWWTPAGGTVPFMQITYDGLGRRTDINRGSSATGYSFESTPWVGSMNQRFAQTYSLFSIARNPSGQVTSVAQTASDYTYTSYYDTARDYVPNGLNQYSSSTGTTYAYDLSGNLASDGTNSYVYDSENHLISSSGSNPTILTYDPLGRLWQTSSPAFGKTQFLYDGSHVVLEYNGENGAVRRRYMWGPSDDEPIFQDEGGALNCSGTRFLHSDIQGSVIASSDCSGNRTSVNTYDEHGISGGSKWGRYRYTGQAWIDDLGLYYYKARFYSPTLGRFLQTDPIGYGDQINLYSYVGNDPINNADTSGLCTGSNIQDADGGCMGGGFINGAGSCYGQCTSGRDVYNAIGNAVVSQSSTANGSSNDQCVNEPECGGNTPQKLKDVLAPLFKSSAFRSAVTEAWARSKPNGPTSSKNEHAFWADNREGKTRVGGIITGLADRVPGAALYQRGENVFFHTHPFTRAEGFEYGFSEQDVRFLHRTNAAGVMMERDGIYFYDGRGK